MRALNENLNRNVTNFMAGSMTSPKSNTIAAVLLAMGLIVYVIWLLIVSVFRKCAERCHSSCCALLRAA